jgi:bifunctional DNase/RNase
MSDTMIHMQIKSVELDFARTLPSAILEELGDKKRKMAIFIDYEFVDHIAEGLKQAVPQAQGMVKAWLDAIPALDGKLTGCEITDYDGRNFVAFLILRRHDGQTARINLTPGSALALTLYSGLPIDVREDLIARSRQYEATDADVDEILNDLDDEVIDQIRETQTSKYKM